MSDYEFGRASCYAIKEYPDIFNRVNESLNDGVDWLENFSGDITGVYKVDDKRYAKLDIERYGASVESKILLYYSRQK